MCVWCVWLAWCVCLLPYSGSRHSLHQPASVPPSHNGLHCLPPLPPFPPFTSGLPICLSTHHSYLPLIRLQPPTSGGCWTFLSPQASYLCLRNTSSSACRRTPCQAWVQAHRQQQQQRCLNFSPVFLPVPSGAAAWVPLSTPWC